MFPAQISLKSLTIIMTALFKEYTCLDRNKSQECMQGLRMAEWWKLLFVAFSSFFCYGEGDYEPVKIIADLKMSSISILIILKMYDIILYCVKKRKKYILFRSVSMSEKYEVGNVVAGKVTGIQPYGAFVALDDSTQGLVHISEITHGYVKDINEHLKVGDEVQVKVLSIDEAAGKIGLSIRATEEAPERPAAPAKKAPKKRQAAVKATTNDSGEGFNTLKDKLQEWIDQSQREDLIKK